MLVPGMRTARAAPARCGGAGAGVPFPGRRMLSASRQQRAKKVGDTGAGAKYKPLPYSPPKRKAPVPIPPPPPPQDVFRFRRIPLMLTGITSFAIAGYVAYLYTSYQRVVKVGVSQDVPEDVSSRYNTIAPEYDASVDLMEMLMGLNKLRKQLAQSATGDVCEVSIGTGRNLSFYDWDFKGFNGVGRVEKDHKIKRGTVKSFTAVDKSAEMLEIAKGKFSKEYPGVPNVQWVVQDASASLPPPPQSANERSGVKNKKFDTIVQTMGLCSTPDPAGLLKNLGDSLEPEGGRILLLEHGRGTWDFINNILDHLAPKHAAEFGCWWNKDIINIVEQSGLELVALKRKHFGTTYWIELRLKRTASEDAILKKLEVERDEHHGKSKTSSWW